MHAAESIPIPAHIRRHWETLAHVRAAYDPAHWSIGYGGTPDGAWQKLWQEADQRGLIAHHQIGQTQCSWFKARSVVSIYKRWRATDPYGLYGVEPLSWVD
jgi:hypothetical protein